MATQACAVKELCTAAMLKWYGDAHVSHFQPLIMKRFLTNYLLCMFYTQPIARAGQGGGAATAVTHPFQRRYKPVPVIQASPEKGWGRTQWSPPDGLVACTQSTTVSLFPWCSHTREHNSLNFFLMFPHKKAHSSIEWLTQVRHCLIDTSRYCLNTNDSI